MSRKPQSRRRATMKCYFDSNDANGQCQSCGRFVCRQHSEMRLRKLVCSECASQAAYEEAEPERQFHQASELLKSVWRSRASKGGLLRCGSCSKLGLPKGVRTSITCKFALLTSEHKSQLASTFRTVYECPNKCIFCWEHKPIFVGTRPGLRMFLSNLSSHLGDWKYWWTSLGIVS